jgi:hypothetical protein
MKIFKLLRALALSVVALAVVPHCSATVIFDLNCVLFNGGCAASAFNFGNVTIDDLGGGGGVSVTVDTSHGGKYKDLFLNLTSAPASLTSPAIYASNGLFLTPYHQGAFDVGTSDGPDKGFDGLDNVPFSILGTGFSELSFIALDSNGLVHVAVHLQQVDCAALGWPCTNDDDGEGSIKVGGTLRLPGDDPPIPEPATIALVGIGLVAAGVIRRKRA